MPTSVCSSAPARDFDSVVSSLPLRESSDEWKDSGLLQVPVEQRTIRPSKADVPRPP
jgi:hypothetical protein